MCFRQLTFLAHRPDGFPAAKEWDTYAAAVLEAIHFSQALLRRGASRPGRAPDLLRARLAELGRRHGRVSMAIAATEAHFYAAS